MEELAVRTGKQVMPALFQRAVRTGLPVVGCSFQGDKTLRLSVYSQSSVHVALYQAGIPISSRHEQFHDYLAPYLLDTCQERPLSSVPVHRRHKPKHNQGMHKHTSAWAKPLLVLGLARTGRAVAAFWHKRGWPLWVWDDQPAARAYAQGQGWALADPAWQYAHQAGQQNNGFSRSVGVKGVHREAGFVVMSPGIATHPLCTWAQDKGWGVISDIQLFFLLFPGIQAVAITGSNGKSTTCTLVHWAINRLHQRGLFPWPAVLAGNIGIPIFDTLSEWGDPADALYVLELSSYQLTLCHFLPLCVAVMLNLSPHHLERHGTMDNYRAIKEKMLAWGQQAWLGPSLAHRVPLVQQARQHQCALSDDDSKGEIYDRNDLRDPGAVGVWPCLPPWIQVPVSMDSAHGQENLGAAYAVVAWLCARRGQPNVDKGGRDVLDDRLLVPADIFQDFQGLAHRQQCLGVYQGAVWMNDSKSTSPAAAVSAFAIVPPLAKICWIAGGLLQQDDWDVWQPFAARVQGLWTFGQAAQRFVGWARQHGVPVHVCADLPQAVAEVNAYLQSGNAARSSSTHWWVVFSPGCASTDQFRDFEHRGQVFCQAVRNLPGTMATTCTS